MVRIPRSFATFATTGAAPVPVPPPMPAVTKTIFVPSSSSRSMSSMLLSASFLPTSGLAPAPKPTVPSCSFTGTGDFDSAALSVLHTANVTPSIPSSYMLPTAFCPPPPTPITLMIFCDWSSTIPKSSTGIFSFLASSIVVI